MELPLTEITGPAVPPLAHLPFRSSTVVIDPTGPTGPTGSTTSPETHFASNHPYTGKGWLSLCVIPAFGGKPDPAVTVIEPCVEEISTTSFWDA